MSLRTRILLAFVLIASIGWVFLFEPVIKRVERQYLEAAEEPMVDMAEVLAAIVSQSLEKDGELPEHLPEAFEQVSGRELEARIYKLIKTQVEMELTITDKQGIVLFDSRGPEHVGTDRSRYFDISRTLRGRYGARSTQTDESQESSSVMHVGAPILIDGKIAGVVSVSKPQRSMLAFIEETRSTLRAIAMTGVAAFLLMGILLARWVTHPLRVLTRHAEAVAKGSRQEPPKLPGHHLKRLGQSLEQMRESLEDRNYVETYVQTLTHEMKGPVAAIRGAAEILDGELPEERRRNFASNIHAEAERLQQLIDRLLALAALENRKRLEAPQHVDLAGVARRVAAELRSHHSESELKIEFDTSGPHRVKGEEFLLETAIRNLVSNAVEFSPADGRIQLSVESDGEWVTLQVADNGPGIPDYAEGKVFEHFYSLPRPRSGRKSSGLGLCFVRECAELHGGSADLANLPDGGAVATLKLPKAQD